MEISVINIKGEDTGRKVELREEIYGIQPNQHAIYLDVKQYLANQRQGTHKTKQRAEVSGSTKKIKRQKGTGTARAGSIKSPIFRGGGTVFGPTPRDYSFKLNKKLKRLARKSALAHKAQNNSIVVLEDFNMDTPKTSEIVNILNSLNLNNQKSTFILSEANRNIYLSIRNLPKRYVIPANGINTYAIMNGGTLVISESSVAVINQMFNLA